MNNFNEDDDIVFYCGDKAVKLSDPVNGDAIDINFDDEFTTYNLHFKVAKNSPDDLFIKNTLKSNIKFKINIETEE